MINKKWGKCIHKKIPVANVLCFINKKVKYLHDGMKLS